MLPRAAGHTLALFSRGARPPAPSRWLRVLVFPRLPPRPRLPVNTRGCRQGLRDWRSPARPPLRRLPSCQLPVRCELDFGATAGEWGFCSITKTSAWMAGLPAPSPARQAERNRLVNVCDLSLETALSISKWSRGGNVASPPRPGSSLPPEWI